MIKDGGFSVEVLADSISPKGHRIITLVGRYPRYIHGEFMTIREFSRNAASSRAIPVRKLMAQVWREPVIPIWWGKNESGMVANVELTGWRRKLAPLIWRLAGIAALFFAWLLVKLDCHKQIVNRLLEPWMWITVIFTSTSFSNFEGLRCHKDAEPHFQKFAKMVMRAIRESTPRQLSYGQWHLPYLNQDDEAWVTKNGDRFADFIKLSVGRCARVSYLTHDGVRDPQKDIELHDRMMVQVPLHASPAEHQAMASEGTEASGNLRGEWLQYRKTFANEYIK